MNNPATLGDLKFFMTMLVLLIGTMTLVTNWHINAAKQEIIEKSINETQGAS